MRSDSVPRPSSSAVTARCPVGARQDDVIFRTLSVSAMLDLVLFTGTSSRGFFGSGFEEPHHDVRLLDTS